MKVLHVTETLPGGIASYLSELVIPQSKEFGSDNLRFVLPAEQVHHVEGLKAKQIYSYRRGEGRSLASLWRLSQAIRQACREFQPDIIHLHSSFAGGVGRLTLLPSKYRPKIVYCAHGWVFGVSPLKSLIFRSAERFLYPFTDAIINISDAEFKLARSVGLPAKKMVTIRNGSSAPTPPELKDLPKRKANLEFMFMGRFDPQKGIDILLKAAQQLVDKDIHFTLIGMPVLGQSLPPLPPNVTHINWLRRDKLTPYLQASDALLVPSRWEGFGLVATEAMSVGTAVIASNVGGLPEIVVDGETGYIFDINRPNALSELLNSVDPKTLKKMGEAGKQRWKKEYTAERMNDEIIYLYNRLMK